MSAATTILSVENYCRDVGGGCRGPTGSRPRRGCGLYASWGTRAEARAIELAPILRDLKQQGLSLRGMAAALTKRRVPTPRGGMWHPQLVAPVLERLEAA